MNLDQMKSLRDRLANDYSFTFDMGFLMLQENCKTTCCIAGNVVLANGWDISWGWHKHPVTGEGVETYAGRMLGLKDDGIAIKLFYSYYWPNKFQSEYLQTNSDLDRRIVAIALIDEIIAGKRDPDTLQEIENKLRYIVFR